MTKQVASLLAFWGAGLPIIMSPNRAIAVDASAVQNANLYFGSWAALAALIFIAGSLAQEVTGVSVRDIAPGGKIIRWFALAATSIIVWATAVRFFVARQCQEATMNHDENCRRTKFAISMGVISFVASFVMVFWIQNGLGTAVEFFVSVFMLILWCFGVGFITFGVSPGAIIGNLYFSAWASFIIVILLFADSFRAYTSQYNQSSSNDENNIAPGESGRTSTAPRIPDEEDI